jgi:hypothetical protein
VVENYQSKFDIFLAHPSPLSPSSTVIATVIAAMVIAQTEPFPLADTKNSEK